MSISAENSEKTAKTRGKPFEKGQSGNPNGRPPRTEEEWDLIAACKGKTPAALETIERIMFESESDKTRLTAALAIIERAHGKAIQPSEVKMEAQVEVRPARPKLTREEWLASLAK